ITVTVTGNLINSLTKDLPFWDDTETFGIINGKLVGGNWVLRGDLWDYWTETSTTGTNKPVVTYEYSVVPTVSGISINDPALPTAEVRLNEGDNTALARVNDGNGVTLRIVRKVNGV